MLLFRDLRHYDCENYRMLNGVCGVIDVRRANLGQRRNFIDERDVSLNYDYWY